MHLCLDSSNWHRDGSATTHKRQRLGAPGTAVNGKEAAPAKAKTFDDLFKELGNRKAEDGEAK
jgi:hypothetical protein